jgi:hypothetical protein
MHPSNPYGCRDQGKGLQMCEPRMKPKNVGECEGMNSHFGCWNPNGLLNLHKAIAGVKIHCIEKFIISLESS